MKKRILYKLIFLLGVFLSGRSLHAGIRLPGIIGNNMVIQRGTAVPVWGWATPGSTISVSFRNKIYRTVALPDGRWSTKLGIYKAGGPFEMQIEGDSSSINLGNILIGDVWLASGQSNMEYGIQSDSDAAAAIAHATDSMIHFFFVPWVTSLQMNTDIGDVPDGSLNGHWIVCSPSALMTKSWAWHGFSAVGYYFAQVLRKDTGCPIGLIGSYKGGTPAQAWVSMSGLQQDPVLERHIIFHKKILADYDSLQKVYPQQMSLFRPELRKWEDEVGKAYNQAIAKWQLDVDAAKAAKKALPIRPQPAVPRPQEPRSPDGGFGAPANLFNGMIAPLIPYAIKGVIWYQGESNGDRIADACEYKVLFPALIRDWRKAWGQGDFPFLFVQLTNYREPAKLPVEGVWPWVREAQSSSLSVPQTGMAVTIDIGDANDIHPKSKSNVGKRLAYAALRIAYGKKNTFSGPVYRSMQVRDTTVEISFSNTGKGLASGRQADSVTGLRGFAVAGEDKKFVWAKAVLKGNTVIVSAAGVDKPVAIRYDWADNPSGNLYNKDGLAASPFRTDNWPCAVSY